MFIRPVENIVTPKVAENIKNMQFISAYELVPFEKLSPLEVIADKFVSNPKTIVEAPANVLESISRIFW